MLRRRGLKELETENARLARMYADYSLTHHALREVVAKSSGPVRAGGPGHRDGQRTRGLHTKCQPTSATDPVLRLRLGSAALRDYGVAIDLIEVYDRENPRRDLDKMHATLRV